MDEERKKLIKEIHRSVKSVQKPPTFVFAYEKGCRAPFRLMFNYWQRRKRLYAVNWLRWKGLKVIQWKATM